MFWKAAFSIRVAKAHMQLLNNFNAAAVSDKDPLFPPFDEDRFGSVMYFWHLFHLSIRYNGVGLYMDPLFCLSINLCVHICAYAVFFYNHCSATSLK